LASVVLFLHEKKELVETPERGTIFILIICQRFLEANHGYAAFVGETVTHE
jgi:hypothetical protein